MNRKLFLSYLQGIQTNNQNLVSFQNSLRKNSWQRPICVFETTITPGTNPNDAGGFGGPGGGKGVFGQNSPEIPIDDSIPSVFRPFDFGEEGDYTDYEEWETDDLSAEERKKYEELLEDLEKIFQETMREYEDCQQSGGNCDALYKQIRELMEQMYNLNNILGNNDPLPPWEDHDGDQIPNDEDEDFNTLEPGGDWDGNGDGIPDTFLNYDTDGDGIPDAYYFDTDGDGIPDRPLGNYKWDSDGDGIPDTTLNHDSDGDGIPDAFFYDTDGDGIPDTIYYDSDGDGELDSYRDIEGFSWPLD